MSERTQNSQEETETNSGPLWLEAKIDDVRDLDFENPIADLTEIDDHELCKRYREAANLHEKLGGDAAPAARVFSLLADATGMHFKPEDRNEPYGPMLVTAEGNRSAIPSDFRDEPKAVLAFAAENSKNPILSARICDVSWLNDRKRADLARKAVMSSVQIIEELENGRLSDRFDKEYGARGSTGKDILTRALQVSRIIKWEEAEAAIAREWVVKLWKKSIKNSEVVHAEWFAEIDLNFGISNPAKIGKRLEKLGSANQPKKHSIPNVELWRLAARAYHYANDEESEFRCRSEAAELLAKAAEAASVKQGSAMVASHWLSSAIAEYHGIPGKKERRSELRQRLIDLQAGIGEEMTSFSEPINIKEIVEYAEKRMDGLELLDAFLIFADLERSPDPEKLTNDAIRAISNHPLSSLFGTSFHDAEGKVVHRSEGGGIGDSGQESSIKVSIAQHEQLRRQLHVNGQVDVARRIIVERHNLTDQIFVSLLQHSPFVPNGLHHTFARGFVRFFQGDFVSALYILTPLLENSVRHVLKLNGHDVTTFNDATQTQEERTITSLYDAMRSELNGILSEAITSDIERVFLSKPGPYIRHQVAHGLLYDGSPYSADSIYACWLIFRLCCIPLFSHRDEIELLI